MSEADFDYADVQGLVRFGYGHLKSASYSLLRIKNAAAARAWLRSALQSNAITTALKRSRPPTTALNVAFTASGLKELGLPEVIINGFSNEFIAGMTQESRVRQLGDVGENTPYGWDWGYAEKEPHLVVMFFSEKEGFDAFVQNSRGAAWQEAFHEIDSLPTSDLDGVEPFGFADGISQPEIDWGQQRESKDVQLEYTNMVALGEFLLGYRNEYGKFTERPLLEADATTNELLAALDEPGRKDLGRNGTYLVMRQLGQDVRKFWQFIDKQAGGDAAERDKLAAAMVGRKTDGEALVPIRNEPIPGIDEKQASKNQFTFDDDPAGAHCPFGAHVRRANPRNADFPEWPANTFKKLITILGFGPNRFRYDLMSSVRFHRILRRGREYGPSLKLLEALGPAPPDDPPRGLNFICLNANISRQFEFLQNAWIANTKFAGLTQESDPLLGIREPLSGCPVTNKFTIPSNNGLGRSVSTLPQFVTVRGGAYFFLPSLRALRYFAAPVNP
jgi:deferrochelatase/peroxidase EfeB